MNSNPLPNRHDNRHEINEILHVNDVIIDHVELVTLDKNDFNKKSLHFIDP